jgi:hypothetical protein
MNHRLCQNKNKIRHSLTKISEVWKTSKFWSKVMALLPTKVGVYINLGYVNNLKQKCSKSREDIVSPVHFRFQIETNFPYRVNCPKTTSVIPMESGEETAPKRSELIRRGHRRLRSAARAAPFRAPANLGRRRTGARWETCGGCVDLASTSVSWNRAHRSEPEFLIPAGGFTLCRADFVSADCHGWPLP